MNVSVIIPVYNTERYVAQAIESVLSQTHPSHEIVVVDDGSTDETPSILNSFGARIAVVRQPQSGPATALNAGIERAGGDLLAFLDADDLWPPDKLQRQCDLLSRQPEIEAAFGQARQFVSPDMQDGDKTAAGPSHDQPGVHKGTMLIRRPAFDRIGLFDSTLRHVDFIEWYGRALAPGLRTHMLPDVLLFRRIHAANTGRVRRDGQRDEDLLALKRTLDLRRRAARPSDP
jgi:glycosyltransferase involved in cell wall biosynthesis